MIFNEILDEEHVMTWMGLILADTGMMDDETLAQAFEQLIAHLEGHIDRTATTKPPNNFHRRQNNR